VIRRLCYLQITAAHHIKLPVFLTVNSSVVSICGGATISGSLFGSRKPIRSTSCNLRSLAGHRIVVKENREIALSHR
jgi:hypothetical protein